MNTQEYLNSCKSCWWQEGGRCYAEPHGWEPDGNGWKRSDRMAETKCEQWNSKRAVLGAVFGDYLTIVSEENAKANDPKPKDTTP